MKKVATKWMSLSLIIRILVGLILGTLLGAFLPQATAVGILGSIFVGALKAVAPVLVFVLVTGAIANAGNGIGSRFKNVIILYVVSTLLAALVSVVGCFIFPVTMKLSLAAAEGAPPSGISEVLRNLIQNAVSNPVAAIANANYIGILCWAIIFGIGLKCLAKKNTISVVNDLSETVSLAVRWVIQLAPFGIMGLVFDAVSENGMSIFYDYGKLLTLLVVCMLIVAFVMNPLIVALYLRKNPYPLVLRCLKDSGITAFFTRSSAANIPVNMTLCERLGINRDFYSVSIPLGATINMSGAAVTITVMTLAVANTMGIVVDIPTAFMLCILSAIGACGTSGVAGGSLLLIPMACSLFSISGDISMQAVAVGFILGVVQDSMETALNSSGDVIFTATAEYRHRRKKV
ncbi:MAG: serine/threonine transporter SstT [Fibrobacteraceae bacterium]|nr:serine/threonine transporter SstT [Fibrobacteraceae bacterium]